MVSPSLPSHLVIHFRFQLTFSTGKQSSKSHGQVIQMCSTEIHIYVPIFSVFYKTSKVAHYDCLDMLIWAFFLSNNHFLSSYFLLVVAYYVVQLLENRPFLVIFLVQRVCGGDGGVWILWEHRSQRSHLSATLLFTRTNTIICSHFGDTKTAIRDRNAGTT